MRTRRTILLLIGIVVVALIGLLVRGAFRSGEPEYAGKTLSQWLPMLRPDTGFADPTPAVEAIRQMGSDAVPYLLKWSRYEPAPWKQKLIGLVDSVLGPFNHSSKSAAVRENEKKTKARQAMYALVALGPKAESAVGHLSQMLGETNLDFGSPKTLAPRALAFIGQPGLPPLITALTNRQTALTFRCYLEGSMARMGTNATSAIPVLRQALTSADWHVRLSATNVLRGIDPTWKENLNRG